MGVVPCALWAGRMRKAEKCGLVVKGTKTEALNVDIRKDGLNISIIRYILDVTRCGLADYILPQSWY